MTEAEWLAAVTPGPILEAVRRRARYRPGVLGRKGRRAVCEVLRLVVPGLNNPTWLEPIERTERFIDGHGRLADIDAAIAAADDVALTSAALTTRWALGVLTKPDPLGAANDALSVATRFLSLRSPGRREPDQEARLQADAVAIVRDVFGNPFRPVAFSPEWRTDTALALAQGMYESREFGAMPILADALQEVPSAKREGFAGCDSEEVLTHCRSGGVHVRGCWAVDLVLGKS